MLYSTDRILVTHAGSLPRPADLRAMVLAKSAGEPYDGAALDRRLGEAVAETVRKQRDAGIDAVQMACGTIGGVAQTVAEGPDVTRRHVRRL